MKILNSLAKFSVAIIAGALSSAAWELIKPVFNRFTDLVLNLATLGLSGLRTKIYMSIAKGFHEQASTDILLLIMSFYLVTFVFMSYFLFKMRNLPETQKNSIPPPPAIFMRLLRMKYLFHILTPIFVTTLILQTSINLYTNRAISHFNQALKICGIVISNQEERRLVSKFSSMSSKEDFDEVMNELKKVAEKNSLSLPEFQTW